MWIVWTVGAEARVCRALQPLIRGFAVGGVGCVGGSWADEWHDLMYVNSIALATVLR